MLHAIVACQDAAAAGGNSDKVSHARDEIASGDANIANAQYEAGIAQYRDAWKEASQLIFKLAAHLSAGRPLIEFDAVPGETLVVETSTNLVDWTELEAVSAGSDGAVRFQDNSAYFDVRYYRARRVESP